MDEATKTISELVRAQVLAEGHQITDARERMVYVDQTLDAMGNTELLDRISDAIASQQSSGGAA